MPFIPSSRSTKADRPASFNVKPSAHGKWKLEGPTMDIGKAGVTHLLRH